MMAGEGDTLPSGHQSSICFHSTRSAQCTVTKRLRVAFDIGTDCIHNTMRTSDGIDHRSCIANVACDRLQPRAYTEQVASPIGCHRELSWQAGTRSTVSPAALPQ
jgi:hypothetical protein